MKSLTTFLFVYGPGHLFVGAHGYGASYAYDDDDGDVEVTYDDPSFSSDSFAVKYNSDANGNISSIVLKRNGSIIDVAATHEYDDDHDLTLAAMWEFPFVQVSLPELNYHNCRH